MNKFKVGDKVIVLSGKDKGKTGEIKSLNWKKNSAVVSDVNLVVKAVKPTQENPNGGFASKENSINISKISLVSPKTGKATRVGFKIVESNLVRFAKKCGSLI